MLADYIRRNDEPLVKSTSALLHFYHEKLLKMADLSDFFNVIGKY